MNMVRALWIKETMKEQMGNVNRETEILRKFKKKSETQKPCKRN